MRNPSRPSERATHWFWRRVAGSTVTSAESLGLFRVFFCLNLLLLDGPYFGWLDRVPRAFYDPPPLSLAYLLRTFPPAPFFAVLDTVYLVALVAVTLGFRTRVATAAVVLLQLVGANFQYSFGKLDHAIVTAVVPACMLVADWGRAVSIDALRATASPSPAAERARARGVALFAVLLAFGMLTAGIPKLLGWVDFDLDTSGLLAWFYPSLLTLERSYLLSSLVPKLPPLLREAGDYFAAMLELAGFFALLTSRRNLRLWLGTLVTFHVLNALVLNIPFGTQTVAYLAFLDWRATLPGGRRLAAWLARKNGLFALGVLAGGAAVAHLAAHFQHRGYMVLFVSGSEPTLIASLYTALAVGIFALTLLFREALALTRARPPSTAE